MTLPGWSWLLHHGFEHLCGADNTLPGLVALGNDLKKAEKKVNI